MVAAAPPGTPVGVAAAPLQGLVEHDEYGPMLAATYRALRPSRRVQALVDAVVAEAVRLAGERWVAMHLPIEWDCGGQRLVPRPAG